MPPEYETPFVVAKNDIGPFVEAILQLPAGSTVLAMSEWMTWSAWADLWGKVLGVACSYRCVSNNEFFTGLPPAMREEFEESFDFFQRSDGHTGGVPNLFTPESLTQVRTRSACRSVAKEISSISTLASPL